MTDTTQNARQPQAPSLKGNDVVAAAEEFISVAQDLSNALSAALDGHDSTAIANFDIAEEKFRAALNDQVEGRELAAESGDHELIPLMVSRTVAKQAVACGNKELTFGTKQAVQNAAAKALANPPSPQSHGEKR